MLPRLRQQWRCRQHRTGVLRSHVMVGCTAHGVSRSHRWAMRSLREGFRVCSQPSGSRRNPHLPRGSPRRGQIPPPPTTSLRSSADTTWSPMRTSGGSLAPAGARHHDSAKPDAVLLPAIRSGVHVRHGGRWGQPAEGHSRSCSRGGRVQIYAESGGARLGRATGGERSGGFCALPTAGDAS